MKISIQLKTLLTLLFLAFTMRLSSCDNSQDNISENFIINNLEETFTSIKINATLTNQNNSIERGISWSTSHKPTIEDNKTVLTTNTIDVSMSGLSVNTTYNFRTYSTTDNGITYSEEKSFKTLSFDNTSWKFATTYSIANNFVLHSKNDFFNDGKTKFDEMDYPGHSPGAYITYGSWSLEGNTLTYLWDAEDSNDATVIYTGIIDGFEIKGTLDYPNSIVYGTWTATLL